MKTAEKDKSFRWILLLGLVVVILLALLIFGAWRARLAGDVNKQLEAIREAGLPTSGAELNAYYPEVPDEENAALGLMEAFDLLRNFSDGRSNEIAQLSLSPKGASLSPEHRELLPSYVQMNEAAIARAREGLQLPKSRYPVDMSAGLDAVLPHLPALRDLARVVSCEGVLAADAQRSEEAAEAVITILRLADTLTDEPLLISALVGFRLQKMAQETLEWSLNAGGVAEDKQYRLNELLHAGERTKAMHQGMIGERAMMMLLFRMGFAQFAAIGDAAGDNPEPAKETLATMPMTFLMRASGFFERDFRFYLGAMETNILAAELSPPASIVAAKRHEEYVTEACVRRRYILSSMLLPALPKAFQRHAESIACLRLSRAALQVEGFRQSNQRLPASVPELLGAANHQWPLDPFDGQSLRYERLPVGYVVYSVGTDGQDDGGRERPPRVNSTDRTTYDLTFIVER